MFYPEEDELDQYIDKGNYLPVYCEVLADTETPVTAYSKLAYKEDGSQIPHAFLLESVEGGENVGRFSFLGVDPIAVFKQNGTSAEVIQAGKKEVFEGEDVFQQLRKYLSRFQQINVPGLPPFKGGAVGYASYEAIHSIEPSVPRLNSDDDLDIPESIFLITDTLLAFDRAKHTLKIISHADFSGDCSPLEAYNKAKVKIQKILNRLNRSTAKSALRPLQTCEPIACKSNMQPEEFHAMVKKAKEYIVEGDIIQVVLSQRFEANFREQPVAVHRALRAINPSPYMFCLQFADFAIVGSSPEVHAKCKEGNIHVRPIAGTRKRDADSAKDQALADELIADEKERAEHIMLVDLARNDIGRIAKTGSVKVTDFMRIERYSHVMHIVSDVEGKLDKEKNSADVMSATFPAGTLSGAPKVRAMQIISELEKTARGPYGGAITYFSFDGNIDSCITIRTVVLKDKKAYVQAGAGIVADSDPQLEFEETCNKAKAILSALALSAKSGN